MTETTEPTTEDIAEPRKPGYYSVQMHEGYDPVPLKWDGEFFLQCGSKYKEDKFHWIGDEIIELQTP